MLVSICQVSHTYICTLKRTYVPLNREQSSGRIIRSLFPWPSTLPLPWQHTCCTVRGNVAVSGHHPGNLQMIQSTSYTDKKRLVHSVDNTDCFLGNSFEYYKIYYNLNENCWALDIVCLFADSWQFASAGSSTGKSS